MLPLLPLLLLLLLLLSLLLLLLLATSWPLSFKPHCWTTEIETKCCLGDKHRHKRWVSILLVLPRDRNEGSEGNDEKSDVALDGPVRLHDVVVDGVRDGDLATRRGDPGHHRQHQQATKKWPGKEQNHHGHPGEHQRILVVIREQEVESLEIKTDEEIPNSTPPGHLREQEAGELRIRDDLEGGRGEVKASRVGRIPE